jgi:DNA-binding MarR family transcriptional regulator
VDDANLANVLGALALRLVDEMDASVTAGGLAASDASALIHLSKYPNATIEELRSPLGLSHSGAVRLADRLTASGLAERHESEGDRRSVALQLTRRGRTEVERIHERRAEVLERAVRSLEPDERASLSKLGRRLLIASVPTPASALRTCRLCDYASCRRCPMDEAFGTPAS